MKPLKALSLTLITLAFVFSTNATANNIQVGETINLTGHNIDDQFMLVEFDLSWENSWRVSSGPRNWDAAWVFIKYRESGGGVWQHAWLNNTGHHAPGMEVDAGLLNPADAFHEMTNPGMGAFIYRSSDGGGNINLEGVRLRWNYGANGVADDAVLDIRVFAVEMVYIPEGPFYLTSGLRNLLQFDFWASYNGSGSNTYDRALDGSLSTYWENNNNSSTRILYVDLGEPVVANTFRIWGSRMPQYVRVRASNHPSSGYVILDPSELQPNANSQWFEWSNDNTTAYRYYRLDVRRRYNSSNQRFRLAAWDSDQWDIFVNSEEQITEVVHDNDGDLHATFPRGYNGFYIMKYPVSQKQYVDFLNTLTREQQQNLFPSTTVGAYLGGSSVTYRNGVRLHEDPGAPQPRVFANHLSASGEPNGPDDGQWIACNYMDYVYGAAFADWAGLRPFTEIEYEKACRGSLEPVRGEYPWGSTAIDWGTGLDNAGTANELVTPATANAAFNRGTGGPVRVGNFARPGTGRAEAGSTYYGVMDMAGNVREQVVTVGNSDGRVFDGSHGDGVLDQHGYANVPGWPGFNASTGIINARAGMGLRGGSHDDRATTATEIVLLETSNRGLATSQPSRDYRNGFRAARTAPQ